jgi:peroxiredoxin
MRLPRGTRVAPFRLPALDGTEFDLAQLSGRPYLLAFFRFAACPFCNLRLRELVTRRQELGSSFTIVAVFDSPLLNLRHFASRHQAPFPVLADDGGRVHRRYGVEQSLGGVVKGMVFRLPALLQAMLVHGYWPTRLRGSLTAMPAEFLVDRAGEIRVAYYGRDEGDHLPFEEIVRFAATETESG